MENAARLEKLGKRLLGMEEVLLCSCTALRMCAGSVPTMTMSLLLLFVCFVCLFWYKGSNFQAAEDFMTEQFGVRARPMADRSDHRSHSVTEHRPFHVV
jgi:hypothetical protein